MRRRIAGLLIAVVCAAVLFAGAMLHPDASGFGTHRQLGVPACSFQVRTGMPCPSCGLTTSVTAVMHGRFALAVKAQPFGLLLVAALLMLGGVGAGQCVTGRVWPAALRPSWWWAAVGMGGMFAGWLIVLAGMR
jgi:hypothetical protein